MKKFFLITVFFILLIGCFNVVFGAEDIEIDITPNTKEWTNSSIMLMININSSLQFDSEETQSVEILIGEETASNNWIELGSEKDSSALHKSYTYMIKENSKVSVRVMSWKAEDKSDIKELATENYEISNIDKTNPIIENIETKVSENSVILNIKATDTESGISSYNVSCDAIQGTITSQTSKIEYRGLEANKEYNFTIIVEDRLGNKSSEEKNIKTSNVVTNTNLSTATQNTEIVNNISDTTIANKKIPDVGNNYYFFIIVFVFILFIFFIKSKGKE